MTKKNVFLLLALLLMTGAVAMAQTNPADTSDIAQRHAQWVAIASGFILSYKLGIIVFMAVILHKLPEGFTITSIMMASGKGKTFSLMAAVGLGVATLAGVLTMGLVGGLVNYGLPLSAGVTIYVAASDLMPEVNEEPGVKLSLCVFAGVLMFFVAREVLHAM